MFLVYNEDLSQGNVTRALIAMYCEIFTYSLTSDILLTPNRRLTTRLCEWHQQQYCNDKTSWAAPLISALPDWLMLLWTEAGNKTIIDKQTALLLWQQIINDTLPPASLLSARSLAELAQSAYDNLTQWQVPLKEITQSNHNNDHQQFLQWAYAFEQACEAQDMVTSHHIPQLLIEQQYQPIAIERIRLYGFDQLPPNIEQLLQYWQQSATIEHIPLAQRNQSTNSQMLATPQHEMQAMAQWAKSQWSQGKTRIGCVHPQLSTIRHQLESTFQHCFEDIKPYNISSGIPLSQCDMIACALSLLSIRPHRIDVAQLSPLLRSPYLNGNAVDDSCGAYIDQLLHDRGQPSISQHTLINILNRASESFKNASLLQRLRHWLSLKRSGSNHHDWLGNAIDTLNAAGWPGQRGFSSEEHQIYQHWQQVLEQFMTLQHSLTNPSPSTALAQLKYLCQQHVFQAKSDDQPIQVLGTLEAAGNDFDCIWFAGLTDDIWPPTARPNPLIPFSLQAKYQLPHATAERELAYCHYITDQLVQATPDVMLSYAKQSDDTELHISPLIQNYPILQAEDKYTKPDIAVSATLLDELIDDQAPAVNPDETIKGGSWIISAQANCPFKAFASVRLQASPLGELHTGIDAREKGTLVHAVLDKLWQQLKSQSALHALDDIALEQLIDHCINEVLTEYTNNDEALFLQSERQRLRQLAQQWMTFEKQRPSFSVQSTEQRFDYPLKQLTLHMIVDRIDLLDSGETLVIDYKTGLQSMRGWFDERLTQPQLPLYATVPSLGADGVAYAEVKRGKFAFKGAASHDIDHTGIKPIEKILDDKCLNWHDLIAHWQEQIHQRAEEFIQGDARVEPDEDSRPCDYCDFHALCRINH